MSKIQKYILISISLVTVLIIGGSVVLVLQSFENQNMTIRQKKVKKQQNKEKLNLNSSDIIKEVNGYSSSYNYDEAIKLLKENNIRNKNEMIRQLKDEQKHLIKWNDPKNISHIFFHSLIVDPEKAFHSQQGKGYDDYMITVSEFTKIIDQLYKNNYVLVNLNQLIKHEPEGNISFTEVALPKGKKPLILSQDDVNYYEYMNNSGFSNKLILDSNKQIKSLYEEKANKKIGDYDVVPIIESFIKKHPDFSYKGAKGTLALTGYNGVLGYRTSKSEYGNNSKTKKEIESALKIANQLKKNGWSFASHTWGHINMTQASLEDIQKDNELWQSEVATIIGKTDILIYPFGADINDWEPYSKNNTKFDYLENQGFKIFCNVDASTPSWGQLGANFYRNARINIDGIRLRSDLNGQNKVLDHFFDVKDVYNQKERINLKN